MPDVLDIKLDKTKISVSNSFDNSDEKEYWLARTPEERFEYMEQLRRINYGDKANERLLRIIESAKCEWVDIKT
jgi:hypothetical protein